MKQFFYKSGLMTAVLIMASMVFVLSAVAYFNQKNLYKPLEQMTDDYAVAYGKTESLADLCKGWQKDEETDFKVRGMKLTDGCALQWGSDPEFPLTEGRLFDTGDYEKGTDTALIREDIEALCEKRNGKLYITIGDEEYEVIGKYREKNSTDDRNSRYIVNLYAKNLPVSEGQYLFYDGGADSLSRLQSAGEKQGSKLSCKRASEASEIINKNILADASGILTILLLAGIFVLMNIFSGIYVWLQGRKKEIVLRKMAGAARGQIYGWLLRDFFLFFTGSFAVAVILVWGIIWGSSHYNVSPALSLLIGNDLEWQGVALSFGAVGLLCTVMVSGFMRHYFKKQIIQLVH